jgi:hypothetical protein
MDDKMVGILVIGGVGIIFMIGLGIYQQYRATKRKETWDWLANEFGLTHMWDEFQQDGVLEGDVGGRHVQARTGTYKKEPSGFSVGINRDLRNGNRSPS